MTSLGSENADLARTLVSWKEIAAFLNRAERTVKRWERERGLPVHRVPGGERGTVFAYPSELRTWLMTEPDTAAEDVTDAEPSEREKSGGLAHPGRFDQASPAADMAGVERPASTGTPAIARPNRPKVHPWLLWTTVPAVAVVIAGAFLLMVRMVTRIHAAEKQPATETHIAADQLPSSNAEQLYLQGRYEWSLRTPDSLVKAIDNYTQAIVQDSSYAPAYAGLAEAYDLLPEYGRLSRDEAFPRAKAAADKSIALDPNLASGHRAKAFALFYGDWDVAGSDAEFKRALALRPDEMDTHHWYATTLFSRLDAADAIAQIDEAVRLSPTSPAVVADAAFIHVFFDRDRAANLRTLREMAQTQPRLASPFRYLAEIDLDDENYPAYLDDLRHTAGISHDPFEESLAAAASSGWERAGKTGLLEGVRELQKKAFDHGNESGYWLGRTYLMLGEPALALRYFNEALRRNDFALMTLAVCPCAAGLKADPGYADLLHRVHQRMYLPSAATANMAASLKSEAESSSPIAPR